MHWFTAHLYVSILSVVGLLLLTGAYVAQRSALSESDTAMTWGGAGGLAFLGGGPRAQEERIRTEDLLRDQNRSAEYSTLPIFSALDDGTAAATDVDLESLLAQLAPPAGGALSPNSDMEGIDAYDYIPRGLLSMDTVSATSNKTPLQKELFEYGNQVGVYIRGFEDMHPDMITVLKNAYEDRTNVEKVAAAIQIGKDYQILGRDLAGIPDVPTSVANMHKALALSYQNAGKKMVTKLQAKNDDEFLAAMHAYNASVLEFTNTFVALATYLSAAGVQFSKSDAGSIFTFSAVSF